MKDIRERFIKQGIPYDNLDKEMIGIIDVLNFDLGLKTQFCCFGHMPYEAPHVIFDESVTDEQILALAELTGNYTYPQIFFYRWVRGYPIKQNWQMKLCLMFDEPESEHIHELKAYWIGVIAERLRGLKDKL
ncbi:hypothetical protein phi18_194 [Bacillus phage phi18]|nr:hypothetical protein phi18_194 [Bacillus phage phi18]UNY49155.1 hypothetical protein sp82g_218 [Bacillus phage SP82G]